MENKVQCDGKCIDCSINQRTYCAAQMAYYNQQEIAAIKAILERNSSETTNPLINRENVVEPSKNDQEA